MDGPKFKVIIVGGSISGLSLAHCLHKAGIDSIVLEKRSEIAANEGASVAIMPNGGRILQQIGIFDTLGTLIEPTRVAHVRFPDGFQFSSPYPKTMREANVVNVDHQGSEGVIVYTQSGHSYQGDLLVGADGVHSQVRTLMWDVAERVQPGVITRDEKTGERRIVK
ncbi:hypothetical protein N7466_003142 [Penicillium verhagenii]|uniref:uncharacterized protein n=1 Tax=Penicillium verhagenii TaxID=1562060 RepID=UPI0025455BFF|nr:uncharacterized protein N7466_003142 [Penicillium verhagenii]KAJ5936692.1 hypothetical protein N7466_003142 [Penicillium verhagenii]